MRQKISLKPNAAHLIIGLGLGLGLLTACPQKKGTEKAAEKAAEVKTEQPDKAVKSNKVDEPAQKVVANGNQGEKSCIKPFKATGESKEIKIAGKSYKLVGDVLNLMDPDADDQYTFGQISDVKEDTPENLGNVKRLLQWMKTQGADAIVVTGDLGETKSAIANVMRAVADFAGPVFVIIGNREGLTDFEAAYAEVAPAHTNLIDLNKVRVFNADDASLISLPGYYNAAYMHSKDGCRYTADDVNALAELSKAATSTLVITSHGPPQQKGITGIDRIHEGANVGDPMLAKYIKEHGVHFGMFGNIHEAGGKATDLSGTEEIRQNTYVSDLFLNPGPADSVQWSMLDGTESVGMGGLFRVKADKAMYKIYRLRPGEAKPVKAAAAAEQKAPAAAQNGAGDKKVAPKADKKAAQ